MVTEKVLVRSVITEKVLVRSVVRIAVSCCVVQNLCTAAPTALSCMIDLSQAELLCCLGRCGIRQRCKECIQSCSLGVQKLSSS